MVQPKKRKDILIHATTLFKVKEIRHILYDASYRRSLEWSDPEIQKAE